MFVFKRDVHWVKLKADRHKLANEHKLAAKLKGDWETTYASAIGLFT